MSRLGANVETLWLRFVEESVYKWSTLYRPTVNIIIPLVLILLLNLGDYKLNSYYGVSPTVTQHNWAIELYTKSLRSDSELWVS